MRHIFRQATIAVAVFAGAFVAASAAQSIATNRGWLPFPAMDDTLQRPSFNASAATSAHFAPAQTSFDRNPYRNHQVQMPSIGRIVDTPVAPWTVRAASLRTALLVDGVAEPVTTDQLALPAGSRFRVRVTSGDSALVEVHAVNPRGIASQGPLWRGTVAAGQSVFTPGLRLDGTRGMETLRVVRHSLVDGTTTEQQVQIWHQ